MAAVVVGYGALCVSPRAHLVVMCMRSHNALLHGISTCPAMQPPTCVVERQHPLGCRRPGRRRHFGVARKAQQAGQERGSSAEAFASLAKIGRGEERKALLPTLPLFLTP